MGEPMPRACGPSASALFCLSALTLAQAFAGDALQKPRIGVMIRVGLLVFPDLPRLDANACRQQDVEGLGGLRET